MKTIVCEMCGNNNLIKQDGVFVCQYCGTQYSVEEAKKMMVEIEGNVDVSGSTVKVDNSASVVKYLQNARRAKDKEDWEETEKYYNLVEQNEPTNIEAIFYSSYGKAMLSLTDADRFKREQKFNVFEKSISTIDENYEVAKSEELEPIITKMSADLIKMTRYSFVYNTTTQNNITTNDSSYTYLMFAKVEIKFIESIENIVKVDPKVYLYKLLVTHYARCIVNRKVAQQTSVLYQERMKNTIEKIKELDPSYVAPEIPQVKTGGCYVATCVYGSYNCPQVWTLRRYRDNTLGGTWYGRAFVKLYYAISPTLVKWFGHTNWFKRMWKGKLDRMVKKLNNKGIENTPYYDNYEE